MLLLFKNQPASACQAVLRASLRPFPRELYSPPPTFLSTTQEPLRHTYFVHLSLLSGLSYLSPVVNGWISMLLWLQLDVPQAAHPHQATSCETPPSEGCASKSYFKMVEKILEILERNRSRFSVLPSVWYIHTLDAPTLEMLNVRLDGALST